MREEAPWERAIKAAKKGKRKTACPFLLLFPSIKESYAAAGLFLRRQHSREQKKRPKEEVPAGLAIYRKRGDSARVGQPS